MYLSHLLIDLGVDPDRPRPGRLWLRNSYRVHQRLCMAFPSATRETDDPDFLKPFAPADFAQQVHVSRAAEAGFLFRVDTQPLGRAVILVQSALEPNWDYAFHNAGHLLAAPPGTRLLDQTFSEGDLLQFRLRANPTKKLSKNHTREGKGVRVGLYTEEDQRTWLSRKGSQGGFHVVSCQVTPEGRARGTSSGHDGQVKMSLLSVRFDGVLQVTDPDALLVTLHSGIGSAKAFGFGLLSLAKEQLTQTGV